METSKNMEFLEQLLAEDEDNLCSYALGDLEKFVQHLMNEVRSQKEKMDKVMADLQKVEAEVTERSARREYFTSLLAQTLPQQEALEEEVRSQEQLLVATHEMERLRGARGAASCGALETRLMEAESLLSAGCQQEKTLRENVQTLTAELGKSKAKLGETTAELQTVESELVAVQEGLVAGRPALGEAAQVISACMGEMGLLRAAAERWGKK